MEARESYVADNDVSNNSGWGIHLFRSSHNIIVRNAADHTRALSRARPTAARPPS